MSLIRNLSLTAVAMGATVSAWAVPMSNPVVNGSPSEVFLVSAPGILTQQATTLAADVVTALSGDATDPTGMVKLGQYGSTPATTLTGTIGGQAITLSDLVKTDWTANANALVIKYISDAYAASHGGASIAAGALATDVLVFLNAVDGLGHSLWGGASDPNIFYVNQDGGNIDIGMAGQYDASAFLNGLFGGGIPAGAQASEVVKVTYAGQTSYLYSFSAIQSGYHLDTNNTTYSGLYQVSLHAVPLPPTLWLFGAGVAAMTLSRRRQQSTAA